MSSLIAFPTPIYTKNISRQNKLQKTKKKLYIQTYHGREQDVKEYVRVTFDRNVACIYEASIWDLIKSSNQSHLK